MYLVRSFSALSFSIICAKNMWEHISCISSLSASSQVTLNYPKGRRGNWLRDLRDLAHLLSAGIVNNVLKSGENGRSKRCKMV